MSGIYTCAGGVPILEDESQQRLVKKRRSRSKADRMLECRCLDPTLDRNFAIRWEALASASRVCRVPI